MKQPNRVEIKNEAKKLLKGNVWKVLKPLAVIFVLSFVVSFVLESFFTVNITNEQGVAISYYTLPGNIINIIYSVVSVLLSFGTTRYVLRFVRGEKIDFKEDVLYYFKNNALFCVLLSFVVGVFTLLWGLLLLIPGIVAAMSYSMTMPLVVDGSKNIMPTIKKSKEMMNGHKMDYFVFILSFLGWMLLGVITLGLAFIWVLPYMNIAEMLYYEKIKELSN